MIHKLSAFLQNEPNLTSREPSCQQAQARWVESHPPSDQDLSALKKGDGRTTGDPTSTQKFGSWADWILSH